FTAIAQEPAPTKQPDKRPAKKKTIAMQQKVREISATPVSRIKTKPGFKVELLYTVPEATQGSWVNLCVDPKGRLITSDQYGKLYRVTPPTEGAKIVVEQIPADIGEAQGLLWAFDSLYVVVNRGRKYPNGLYRVTSSKNDDRLDAVVKLKAFPPGGGEHGPHAIVLGPDGKSLYVIAGNHTKLFETDTTTVPKLWGEDFIVPRQWDANGHARGILAPGGWTCRTDKDGKKWELVSMGYRNHYDIAFNHEGELFTFDSDMEWDMNTPWYRPIRICHSVPGSDFGWRSGTGVYPDYFIDNLPPVVNVGQGSPTGIAFGYGAKFPATYQNALFCCDWSYGKLYAMFLKPSGSTYTAKFEEFLTGTPLPLTDIVVNPKDGAMYFTTGGRKVTSGLYRLTYVGNESTAPAKESSLDGAAAREVRHKLEALYGKPHEGAVDIAWPHLGSSDPFLRWAARTVLEFNDPASYRVRALAENDRKAAFESILALIRTGKHDDSELATKVLERLHRFAPEALDEAAILDMLRLYQLTFLRLGPPSDSARKQVLERVDAMIPASSSKPITSEALKLLCYFQAPSAATKGVGIMLKAPTREEQMDCALSLRSLKAGWTPKLREEYFGWFVKAAGYRGGHSFTGFIDNIKKEAVDTLTAAEKKTLKPILEATPKIDNPWANAKPRPFVKHYTLDNLLPIVDKGLHDRDFERGRLMFGEAKCFACHRFASEGGAFGPDLTALAGRFNAKDLIESIVEPSKVISDQYAAVNIVTTSGKMVSGRIINLAGDKMMVNTDMLDPDKLVNVSRGDVESMELSKISMMPENLIDTFREDEVLDLVGFLLSRGNPRDAMFKK
ncbi:MAG TPA: heme-binding protein, partial [Gemmataceae bacterium]|nr:heme-binding protein [Gemmataceae bacterium]